MTKKQLTRKIKQRKLLLNFLLKYFAPSNRYIIYLSQNLDKHVALYQRYLYVKNKKKRKKIQVASKKAA